MKTKKKTENSGSNITPKEKGNENFLEKIGWVGSGLVVCGYCLNANNYVSCWPVWIFGNGMIAFYCYRKGAYSTAVMSFVILLINIYGWISWS